MKNKVLVEFSGVIASPTNNKSEFVEIEDHFTIKDLLQKLGYKDLHHKFIIVSINNTKATLDTRIHNNDKIDLFLPTGGG